MWTFGSGRSWCHRWACSPPPASGPDNPPRDERGPPTPRSPARRPLRKHQRKVTRYSSELFKMPPHPVSSAAPVKIVCFTCGGGGGGGLLRGGGGGGGRGSREALQGEDAPVVQQQLSCWLDVSARPSESSFRRLPLKTQIQQLQRHRGQTWVQ